MRWLNFCGKDQRICCLFQKPASWWVFKKRWLNFVPLWRDGAVWIQKNHLYTRENSRDVWLDKRLLAESLLIHNKISQRQWLKDFHWLDQWWRHPSLAGSIPEPASSSPELSRLGSSGGSELAVLSSIQEIDNRDNITFHYPQWSLHT